MLLYYGRTLFLVERLIILNLIQKLCLELWCLVCLVDQYVFQKYCPLQNWVHISLWILTMILSISHWVEAKLVFGMAIETTKVLFVVWYRTAATMVKERWYIFIIWLYTFVENIRNIWLTEKIIELLFQLDWAIYWNYIN